MIEHVYRRAAAATSVSSVLVATDDERILEAVRAFGGVACMTSPDHQSGTDRLAEVAAELGSEIVVNVQGDEPLIEPAMIDEAVEPLLADPMVVMSTLRRRIDDTADLAQPERRPRSSSIARATRSTSRARRSRSRAPAVRRRRAWRHIGLYVYRRDCLLQLAALRRRALERSEALEQLRALEHGIRILAVETNYDSIGVDTPDDLERVRRLIAGALRV